MAFTYQLATKLGSYLVKNWALGKKRFPFVLMLEPTERCNLRCAGCGRIHEYADFLDQQLSVDQCVKAVEEAGAPVVSISGGEPLLHPNIKEIAKEIIAKRKFVHLCTNGLLLRESLAKFNPGPYMSFVVHLDGLAESHDSITGRKGTFETAIEGIKEAKRAGFRVYTNTTVYKGLSFEEIESLFDLLSSIGVDGFMISPAFAFQEADTNAFLSREEAIEALQPLEKLRKRFQFYNTSAYLDFLMGKKKAQCMPWSVPTFTPKGWRRPCYLIADEHCNSFKELMNQTDWDKYGLGNDPRCAGCMVHSGFEASLIDQARHSLPDIFQLVKG